MNEFYIIRWPQNMSAVYVNGATIKYSNNQSVYYANEVLSPGQTICTWSSATDYLSSGNPPSLPLLKVNKTYELSLKLQSDRGLAVQVQIDFFDAQRKLLDSYWGTELRFSINVPKGTVSYEVRLVNLTHKWICFEFLSIGEIGAIEKIFEICSRAHYDWVHTRPIRDSNVGKIKLMVNKGPRSILPISLDDSIDYEKVFIYTDGKQIEQLIKSLSQTLRFNHSNQLILEEGLGYYHLPSEFIVKFKKGLKKIKILGGMNNDELDH